MVKTSASGKSFLGFDDVAENLIPLTDGTYDLGSSTKAWQNLYTDNIKTTSGTDLTLLPTGTAITVIGDAGSTSQSLTSNDDLFVAGKLEVDGIIYSENLLILDSITGNNDPAHFEFKENGSSVAFIKPFYGYNQMCFFLADEIGKQFIIADVSSWDRNFDHSTQTNPKLFIQSNTNPDTNNTQWISFTHNQTDGVIDVGTGDLFLNPAGNVTHKDITKSFHMQVGSFNSPPSNPMNQSILGMFPVALADDTTEESMHVSIHVPTDWKAGTDIDVHLHYMNVGLQSGTNAVIFGIEYAAVADNEDGTPATTTVEITDTLANNEAADVWHNTASLSIVSANISAGDVIGIRIFRKAADGSDTMTGDAAIDGFHVDYTSDKI